MNFKFYFGLTITFFTLLSSCSSDPGCCGTSTIKGNVILEEVNEITCVGQQSAAIETDVYLIYGDDDIYSDDTKTHFNGNYQFEFLKKGSYQVFAYSKLDSTCQGPTYPIIKTFEIIDNGKTINVEDIIIREKE